MGTPETPIGPICSICGQFEAIGSLMNLADYSTVRFCAPCAPEYLGSILAALTGADQAAAGAEDAQGAPSESAAADGETTAAADATDDPDDEQGSAADHWASTRNVVRSTHGHRGGRRPADDDRGDRG